jgi:hypothetical protein
MGLCYFFALVNLLACLPQAGRMGSDKKLLLLLKIITINIKFNFEPFYSFAIKPQPGNIENKNILYLKTIAAGRIIWIGR